MTINQQPAALNHSGNLVDLIVTDTVPVALKLFKGAELLLEESYSPGAGNLITVKLKDLIDGLLSIQAPGAATVQHQSAGYGDFRIELNSATNIDFRVVKGGVNTESPDAAAFLLANFLTWQPTLKYVLSGDPEYLTYYAAQASNVRVKGYLANSTSPTVTLASLPAGQLTTINVSYSKITPLFASQPYAFEVWVEIGGVVKSYLQRYVLSKETFVYDDLFLFENTIGGIDTIRFIGQKEAVDNYTFDKGLFNESTIDYFVNPELSYSKETGYFRSDRERIWSLEFFKSLQKYHYTGALLKRITLSKINLESVAGELTNYSFNFSYSKVNRFLQMDRESLPVVVNESIKIYYGASSTQPTTSAAVKALQFSVPEGTSEISLETTTNRIFTVAFRSNMVLEKAYDAISDEDLTGVYLKNATILSIDGQSYKVCTMVMAIPYSTSHLHSFIIKNG